MSTIIVYSELYHKRIPIVLRHASRELVIDVKEEDEEDENNEQDTIVVNDILLDKYAKEFANPQSAKDILSRITLSINDHKATDYDYVHLVDLLPYVTAIYVSDSKASNALGEEVQLDADLLSALHGINGVIFTEDLEQFAFDIMNCSWCALNRFVKHTMIKVDANRTLVILCFDSESG
jgi:hypothetical protein